MSAVTYEIEVILKNQTIKMEGVSHGERTKINEIITSAFSWWNPLRARCIRFDSAYASVIFNVSDVVAVRSTMTMALKP